jgi:multidrug efflux pump subunit AcrA (membrane-fusion protein)
MRTTILLLPLCLALIGCGREASKKEAGEMAGKDLPSFKEGKGLSLSEETRRFIGLEIAEVSERKLAGQVITEVQVYQSESNSVHAIGLISREQTKLLQSGQSVYLATKDGKSSDGKLLRVDAQIQSASGQVELIVQIPGTEKEYARGISLTATFNAAKEENVTVIPRSALLRAAEGDFVYAVNGDHLTRTAVKVGAESGDFIEITDGLYSGDKVAVKPVQTLWLTELRFVKGGAACSD